MDAFLHRLGASMLDADSCLALLGTVEARRRASGLTPLSRSRDTRLGGCRPETSLFRLVLLAVANEF